MSNQRTNQIFLFKRIIPIASNTFREAVRDRVLYNLVLFVLLLTASAIFLGELTAGQETRTIVNLGLSAMLLFGTFISIFVGVSLVSKEIERRTVYAIFSKPVGRGEFIIGKYLGLSTVLAVLVATMTAIYLVFLQFGNIPYTIASILIAAIFFSLNSSAIRHVGNGGGDAEMLLLKQYSALPLWLKSFLKITSAKSKKANSAQHLKQLNWHRKSKPLSKKQRQAQ